MSEPQQERQNRSASDNSAGKSIEKSGDGKDHSKSHDQEPQFSSVSERRKRMRTMFRSLHAMLPHLPARADKPTIVDGAVSYVKTLEHTLQDLKRRKLERLQSVSNSSEAFRIRTDQPSSSKATSNPSIPHFPVPVGFETWVSPNVVLNICGDEAQFSVCPPKKQCVFSTICFVLEKYKIEVLAAHISSEDNRSLYMIQAHANRDLNKLQVPFSADEIFKQAAQEIMLHLS